MFDKVSTTILWEKAVAFHGHKYPGIALGVVMSQMLLEHFSPAAIHDLVAVVEYPMCPVDPFQALRTRETLCTPCNKRVVS